MAPNETVNSNPYSSHDQLGSALSSARRAKGISLEQASQELNILPRHLQALEKQDYEHLPQKAFTRGFVINYSRYLGLDQEAMLAAFNASYPHTLDISASPQSSIQQPLGTLQRTQKRQIRFNPWIFLAAAVLFLVVGFIFYQIQKNSDPVETVDMTEVTDSLSRDEQAQGAAIDTAIIADTDTTTATTVAEDDNSATTALPQLSATQLAAIEPMALEFWVRASTQIKIIDATGEVIVEGEHPRGQLKATVKPPFLLQADPADRITVEIDNQLFDLVPYRENNTIDTVINPNES